MTGGALALEREMGLARASDRASEMGRNEFPKGRRMPGSVGNGWLGEGMGQEEGMKFQGRLMGGDDVAARAR